MNLSFNSISYRSETKTHAQPHHLPPQTNPPKSPQTFPKKSSQEQFEKTVFFWFESFGNGGDVGDDGVCSADLLGGNGVGDDFLCVVLWTFFGRDCMQNFLLACLLVVCV